MRQLFSKIVLYTLLQTATDKVLFIFCPPVPGTRIFQDWVIVASSPDAGHPVTKSLFSSHCGAWDAANGPQRLGLRDDQVSGDLKSCNEGTQLNLLAGAHRKSVPKWDQKVRAENTTDSNPLTRKERSKTEHLHRPGGNEDSSWTSPCMCPLTFSSLS